MEILIWYTAYMAVSCVVVSGAGAIIGLSS